MSKTNGGAAFPDPGRAQSAKQREKLTETGMTLQDYFVAHAPFTLQDARTLWAVGESKPATYEDLIRLLATMAIMYSEALLSMRSTDDAYVAAEEAGAP